MSPSVFFNYIAGIVYTAVNFFHSTNTAPSALYSSLKPVLVPFGGGGVGLAGDESPAGRSGLPDGPVGRARHPCVNQRVGELCWAPATARPVASLCSLQTSLPRSRQGLHVLPWAADRSSCLELKVSSTPVTTQDWELSCSGSLTTNISERGRRDGFVNPLCYGHKIHWPWACYPGYHLEQDRSSHPQPL